MKLLAAALALTLLFQLPVYALAPRSIYSLRGPVTDQELADFSEDFVGEVEHRLRIVRQRFSNFPVEVREAFVRAYVEHVMLNELSAERMPRLLQGRPLPTRAQWVKLGHWMRWTFREKLDERLGTRYYFDPLGDLMAIWTHEILDKHRPEEIAAWDKERQSVVSWILLRNLNHITNHHGRFNKGIKHEGEEKEQPNSGHSDLFELRRLKDFMRQAEGAMPFAYLTQVAFEDRPYVERFLEYPLDLKPWLNPIAEHNEAPVVYFIGLHDLIFGDDTMYGLYRVFDKPLWDEGVLTGFWEKTEKTLSQKDTRDWFEGLFRLYGMSIVMAQGQWGEGLKEAFPGLQFGGLINGPIPAISLVERYAKLSGMPAVRAESLSLQGMKKEYSDSERRNYPYLAALTRPFPIKLPHEILLRLNEAFNQAFSNPQKGRMSYMYTNAIWWGPREIALLDRVIPGPGSAYHKLAVLLAWHYSPMFDIHATVMPKGQWYADEGNIEVIVDPLFDLIADSDAEVMRQRNKEYYAQIKDFLENPNYHALHFPLHSESPKRAESEAELNSMHQKILLDAWRRIGEIYGEDVRKIRDTAFKDFAFSVKARSVRPEARRLYPKLGANRAFYLPQAEYERMCKDNPEIRTSLLPILGIVSGGIYYFETDEELVKIIAAGNSSQLAVLMETFGISNVGMLLKIPKSQLFHECCEEALDKSGIEHSVTYPYLGHISLEVINEELRFAALMGKEEFVYQLNSRILDFTAKLEEHSGWPNNIKEIIENYLIMIKAKKANLQSSWEEYSKEGKERLASGLKNVSTSVAKITEGLSVESVAFVGKSI